MILKVMSRATSLLTSFTIGATALTFAALTSGCAGDASLPDIAPEPYVGPAVALDSSTDSHVIVLSAPTPGYGMIIDRIEQERGFREIFVTIRKPNPQFAYAQVVVNQRAATGVSTKETIKVYVRFLDHLDSEGAYRFAIGSEHRKP